MWICSAKLWLPSLYSRKFLFWCEFLSSRGVSQPILAKSCEERSQIWILDTIALLKSAFDVPISRIGYLFKLNMLEPLLDPPVVGNPRLVTSSTSQSAVRNTVCITMYRRNSLKETSKTMIFLHVDFYLLAAFIRTNLPKRFSWTVNIRLFTVLAFVGSIKILIMMTV